MRTSTCLLLVASMCLISVYADFDNNPPIPGKRPQWVTGGNKVGIDLEIVYDLMCSDSADANPEFQKFLNMTWLTSTVSDQIKITYTFMPLPYHHQVWIPHKLVPYMLDVCD